MKIQLTQRDIETAMATYVNAMGLNGKIESMSFTRTRSGKGGESEFYVDIEIFREGEYAPLAKAEEPVSQPKPKKAKAAKTETKAEAKPEPELVKETPAEDPQENFIKEEEAPAPFMTSAEDEAAKAAQTEAEEAAQDAEEEQSAPIASTGGKSLFTN